MKNLTDIQFQPIQEYRKEYYSTYQPPSTNSLFAILEITLLKDEDAEDKEKVAHLLEAEAKKWILRYRIPIHAAAFNPAGDLISLEKSKPANFLIIKPEDSAKGQYLHWGPLPNKEYTPLSSETLKSIFHDIPYRTEKEIRESAERSRSKTKRIVRTGTLLVILWLVVIPTGIAIIGFASPLFGLILFVLSLIKG